MNSLDGDHNDTCAGVDNTDDAEQTNNNMQTVVTPYVAPDLKEQADSRLIDTHNYNSIENDAYNLDKYHYIEKRLTPENDEQIDVDLDDKLDEDLEVCDDNDFSDYTSQNDEIDNAQTESNKEYINIDDSKQEDYFEPSWHPHVYGKPPKKPTPHSIEYILGIARSTSDKKEIRKPNVSQLINVKRSFDSKLNVGAEKKDNAIECNQELRKISNVHRNKVLHEQLLQRTARSSVSDNYGSSEPLNLSVPKLKEVWTSDDDKLVKGQLVLFQFG